MASTPYQQLLVGGEQGLPLVQQQSSDDALASSVVSYQRETNNKRKRVTDILLGTEAALNTAVINRQREINKMSQQIEELVARLGAADAEIISFRQSGAAPEEVARMRQQLANQEAALANLRGWVEQTLLTFPEGWPSVALQKTMEETKREPGLRTAWAEILRLAGEIGRDSNYPDPTKAVARLLNNKLAYAETSNEVLNDSQNIGKAWNKYKTDFPDETPPKPVTPAFVSKVLTHSGAINVSPKILEVTADFMQSGSKSLADLQSRIEAALAPEAQELATQVLVNQETGELMIDDTTEEDMLRANEAVPWVVPRRQDTTQTLQR